MRVWPCWSHWLPDEESTGVSERPSHTRESLIVLTLGLSFFALLPAFRYPPSIMASPLDPNDLVTLDELSISNMWEVAAVIAVLEKKGILPKGR